jgi:cardiolipin synthase A/B
MKTQAKSRKYFKKDSTYFKLQKTFTGILASLILLGFYWITENLTTVELPASDDPPVLYSNQIRDDLERTLASAIHQAKRSVLLIIYTLTDEAIIQALKGKSEENGIDVKVICDGRACPFVERKLGSRVQVVKRFGDGLMHQKILVIDAAQVWIGSANMTTESLKMHGNLITAMHTSALAEMLIAKGNSLPEEGRGVALTHREFSMAGQKVEMWFLPDDPQALGKLKSLIAAAKKTLRIAMFTWTRIDLANAVIESAKNGVAVEVVLDHYSGKGASANVARHLKKHGIPVYFSQGPALLHHKFMVIDENILVNGSANWTKAAFTQNDDCFLVLHDLLDKQKDQLKDLWKVIIKEAKQ